MMFCRRKRIFPGFLVSKALKRAFHDLRLFKSVKFCFFFSLVFTYKKTLTMIFFPPQAFSSCFSYSNIFPLCSLLFSLAEMSLPLNLITAV